MTSVTESAILLREWDLLTTQWRRSARRLLLRSTHHRQRQGTGKTGTLCVTLASMSFQQRTHSVREQRILVSSEPALLPFSL